NTQKPAEQQPQQPFFHDRLPTVRSNSSLLLAETDNSFRVGRKKRPLSRTPGISNRRAVFQSARLVARTTVVSHSSLRRADFQSARLVARRSVDRLPPGELAIRHP